MAFYQMASTNTYKKYSLGDSTSLIISNDDTGNILEFSYNGSTTEGILYGEDTLELENVYQREVYIRSYVTDQHCNFRLWGYGKALTQQIKGTGGIKKPPAENVPFGQSINIPPNQNDSISNY